MSNSEGTEPVDQRLDDVARTVRFLVETMRTHGLTKLAVDVGDISIRLRAGATGEPTVARRSPAPSSMAETAPETSPQQGHVVSAPMIGTFYTSASPGDPPFVRAGDRVEAGQTIGIIEAMKIMNEIASDRSGIVIDVLASNAQPVEYGSPLLRLRLDEFEE